MALLHKLVCVATPYDLRLNLAKAVLLPKISTYIFTLHQPTLNRARQQDPRVGVVPDSVKLLIGVHYNVSLSC